MVAIGDETGKDGVFKEPNNRYLVQRAEVKDLDTIAGEKVVMVIQVAELKKKQFHWQNKSAAQANRYNR